MPKIVDHTGETFTGFVITGRGKVLNGYHTWCGKCLHCGRTVMLPYGSFSKQQSCGCLKRKESRCLYIAVTPDRYELPVAVADTAEDLAAMLNVSVVQVRCGVTPSYVARQMRKMHRDRSRVDYYYIRVQL